jgi:gliding motility-associated lipoprotein GldD
MFNYKITYRSGYLLILLLGIISCGNESYRMPKMRMYPKINFPKNVTIQKLDNQCPYTFEYASYFTYEKDSLYFGEKPINDCWFNLQAKEMNSTLHCSYLSFNNNDQLTKYVNDAFIVSDEHNDKASARKESLIDNGKNVKGVFFEIAGPVATSIQFFVTDSTKHFLRGSLYINDKVNPDSTAPIVEYLKKDILKSIESLEWKNRLPK